MNPIPSQVIERACALIQEQGGVTLSPCSVNSLGRVFLCAAAAVAAAGIELSEGIVARKAFERSLVSTSTSRNVHAVFSRFGWNQQECRALMRQNDALAQKGKERIRSVFRQFGWDQKVCTAFMKENDSVTQRGAVQELLTFLKGRGFMASQQAA